MRCAWKDLIAVLPAKFSHEVDRIGPEGVEEVRLRLGQTPELVCREGSYWLRDLVCQADLDFCINVASRYSPWSALSVGWGYITARGGHRIGICGETVIKDGIMTGFRRVDSVCIRVAKDPEGIGGQAMHLTGSILILGPPGSGKTTLLRDLARQISQKMQVCVVDERLELFPDHFLMGKRMDVLKGCPKPLGIDMVLRTMGPSCIAVDEITAPEDCGALQQAAWCGVRLLATAHAGSIQDFHTRHLYKPLVDSRVFDHYLVLDRTKAWKECKLQEW